MNHRPTNKPETGPISPDELVLWTIQTEQATRRLQERGVLCADGRCIWQDHRKPYQWMSCQLARRVGRPPRGVQYPLWAWQAWDPPRLRPDLRSIAEFPVHGRKARIEIVVPKSRVLLSDFMRWHWVLNNWYLADDEKEDAAAEAHPVNRRQMVKSWDRIFELERGDPAYHSPVEDRSVQAVLWQIELTNVRKIDWFVPRNGMSH